MCHGRHSSLVWGVKEFLAKQSTGNKRGKVRNTHTSSSLWNRKGLVHIFPCFFLKYWHRPCSDGTTTTLLTGRPNIQIFISFFGFKLHSIVSHKNSWSTSLKSKAVTIESRYCKGNKGKLLLNLQKFSIMHYSYLLQCSRQSPTELSTEAAAQEISFVLKTTSLYLSIIWFLGHNLK